MGIDKKILEEIKRYNSINRYISEQDAALPPPPGEDPLAAPAAPTDVPPAPDAGMTPPPAPTTGTTVDVETDPDVEKVGDEKEKKSEVEEIDVTDLVKSQKNVEEKQQDYFDSLFQHLTDLESKLSVMDTLVDKLNSLESKVEKMRPRTANEKLELRTLDSGPFNQKLTDYFEDKKEDFEKTGREEYILTQDEVQNFNPNEIRRSFRNFEDEDEQFQQVR